MKMKKAMRTFAGAAILMVLAMVFALSAAAGEELCTNGGDHTPEETWRDAEYPATCTSQARMRTELLCQVCGKVLDYQEERYGELAAHRPGEPEITHKEASCKADELQITVVSCKVCFGQISRDVKLLSFRRHTPGEAEIVTIPPTCTEDGSKTTTVSCTVCSETIGEDTEVIPALGHTPETAVEETLPTCTESGSRTTKVSCAVCQIPLSTETVEISAPGHAPETTVKETLPTCTEDGSKTTTVSCAVCQLPLSTETAVIPALGHDAQRSVTTIAAATCERAAVYKIEFTCSRCNNITGQSFVDGMGKAEHTEDYNKPGYCSKCNGHVFSSGAAVSLGKGNNAVTRLLEKTKRDGVSISELYKSKENEKESDDLKSFLDDGSDNGYIVPLIGLDKKLDKEKRDMKFMGLVIKVNKEGGKIDTKLIYEYKANQGLGTLVLGPASSSELPGAASFQSGIMVTNMEDLKVKSPSPSLTASKQTIEGLLNQFRGLASVSFTSSIQGVAEAAEVIGEKLVRIKELDEMLGSPNYYSEEQLKMIRLEIKAMFKEIGRVYTDLLNFGEASGIAGLPGEIGILLDLLLRLEELHDKEGQFDEKFTCCNQAIMAVEKISDECGAALTGKTTVSAAAGGSAGVPFQINAGLSQAQPVTEDVAREQTAPAKRPNMQVMSDEMGSFHFYKDELVSDNFIIKLNYAGF